MKNRLLSLYKTKGFTVLSSHLKHLQDIQKETPESRSEQAIEDLNGILLKLNQASSDQQTSEREVSVVIDRSKKDIGILIRLYQLQKRLSIIYSFVGQWKPVRLYRFKIRCIGQA